MGKLTMGFERDSKGRPVFNESRFQLEGLVDQKGHPLPMILARADKIKWTHAFQALCIFLVRTAANAFSLTDTAFEPMCLRARMSLCEVLNDVKKDRLSWPIELLGYYKCSLTPTILKVIHKVTVKPTPRLELDTGILVPSDLEISWNGAVMRNAKQLRELATTMEKVYFPEDLITENEVNVELRLLIERWDPKGQEFRLIATSDSDTRNMERGRARVYTGDIIRIRVDVNQNGFLTVFTIGPEGDRNLLYPDVFPGEKATTKATISDVVLTEPEGLERLFAFWSPERWSSCWTELARFVEGSDATSQASLTQLRQNGCRLVELRMDHYPAKENDR
jgi:hypothetical protein